MLERIKNIFRKKSEDFSYDTLAWRNFPTESGFEKPQIDFKDLIFSCYGTNLNDEESKSVMRQMQDGGYIDEIKDRLSVMGIKLSVYINISQIYLEAVSGERYRIVFVGSSKKKTIDTQEVDYIFQDLKDDFSKLDLNVRYNTFLLG